MIPDTYSEVGSLVVGKGPYCGNCGRVRGDHCHSCSNCDAVGVLCTPCFTVEAKQHAEATQHDPAGNLLNR